MSEAQVILGDSLEALKQMDSEIFDLVLLDAPYFDYKTGFREHSQHPEIKHHRDIEKDKKLSQSLIQQSREDQLETVKESIRVLKPDRAFFYFTNWQESWWFQQKFYTFLRNEIIWDKGNWSAGSLFDSFGNRYEVIFLGTKGKGWKYKGKRLDDIWDDIPRVGTQRTHPTEKPVELYKRLIEVSTNEGDTILDCYGGSGSSAIAALELNRNILVYELDQEYYNRIQRRITEWKENHG